MTLDYLAGIIDGEGTISLMLEHGKKAGRFGTWHARISVSNTHLGLIEALKRGFGGFIHQLKRSNLEWKDSFVWIYSISKKDEMFVQELAKRVIVKRKQFKILLAFVSTFSGGRGYHLGEDGHKKRVALKIALVKANNSHKGLLSKYH